MASWLSGVTLRFSWGSGVETRLLGSALDAPSDDLVDVTRMDCVLVRPLEGVERAEGVVGLTLSLDPAVSLRADVTPLLADAELTSEVVLMLDTPLAFESVRVLEAGGIRVLPTEGEEEEEGAGEVSAVPGDPRTEERTPRTEVRAGLSRLKALSARMEALAALSLFSVLSLPRNDLREAASRLKPGSASAAGAGAARARAELLVERM